MSEYRFRAGEKGELVLQVRKYPDPTPYYADNRTPTWEDATVHDIPVFDPFSPPRDQYPGPVMHVREMPE